MEHRHMNPRLNSSASRFFGILIAAGLLLSSLAAYGSEEEFLPWEQVRIVSPEREDTGRVSFTAEVREGEWRSVEIDAFGRQFKLNDEQLHQLAGFPLSSLRTTHEGGYPLLGGHTVHFKFDKTHYRDERLTRSGVVISVNRGRGLEVSEPRHQTVGPAPTKPPTLSEALAIAERAVANDLRFHDDFKQVNSVQRTRAGRGPREGEAVWRVHWLSPPGPAHFVEVYMDRTSRVVVEGR
jgi:hypothetical protein